jgi:serine protease Do
MRQKALVRGLVAAGVLSAALVGYSQLGLSLPSLAQANPAPAAVAVAAQAGAATLPSFSTIAKQYGPAVVNISVTGDAQKTAAMPGMPNMDPDDPFYEFFKRFNGPMPQMPRGEAPSHGQGSGFIVNKDGVILTNAHVVDGAKEVDVKLTDKREFRAKVLGVDPQTDVAVLKIEAHDLPVVTLGDPQQSNVGDWVLAIGSPFGFENTVTAGIISAKARALPDETYVPFIQTDVAVNPGNSGGPLFNMKGEVIGINSQIFSRTGGYQGLSFSIPIDVAVKVQDQLVQHGKVTRGRIGVTIQGVNQALADSFGLKEPAGALVSQVEKGSPADKAGIEPGDVIVKVNGKAVQDSSELPAQIADLKPGASASLEIVRKGTTKNVEVTIGTLKDNKVAAKSSGQAEKGRLGVAVRPLAPEEQKQAGVEGGLVVEEVAGAAARAGIQTGDVILSLNGTPIKDAEQLRELVSKSSKHVAVLVQREEARIFIPVDLG